MLGGGDHGLVFEVDINGERRALKITANRKEYDVHCAAYQFSPKIVVTPYERYSESLEELFDNYGELKGVLHVIHGIQSTQRKNASLAIKDGKMGLCIDNSVPSWCKKLGRNKMGGTFVKFHCYTMELMCGVAWPVPNDTLREYHRLREYLGNFGIVIGDHVTSSGHVIEKNWLFTKSECKITDFSVS